MIECVHRVDGSATCSLDWGECDGCGKEESMGITNELRWRCNDLLAIADDIDEEYDDIRKKNAKDSVPIGALGKDWIRLPMDADGMIVRVGDRMTDPDGEPFVVSSVDYGMHSASHDGMSWMLWSEDAETFECAGLCRHAPSAHDAVEASLYKAVMLDREGKYSPSAAEITVMASALLRQLGLEDAWASRTS